MDEAIPVKKKHLVLRREAIAGSVVTVDAAACRTLRPASSMPSAILAAIMLATAPPVTAQSGSTDRVSESSDGAQANDSSDFPSISADGFAVAFESDASDLVTVDTNGFGDVFVHDRQSGETTMVSVSSSGAQGNAGSLLASISSDGGFVAFMSWASNLVSNDTNGCDDVYVHERDTGLTVRVSVSSAGEQGNGASSSPSISSDGRFVAFQSWANNLVPGDTNGAEDIFVHDRATGTTTLVSVPSGGTQGGNSSSMHASISSDGRTVAFSSSASDLVPGDTNGVLDVFVHDCTTGQTTRVSVDSSGDQGNSASYYPSISGGGRHVTFTSVASDLVPGDTNGETDVFVHDRATRQVTRVSVGSGGQQADDSSALSCMSSNGRYVAFESASSNLVPGDVNGFWDVFVHDRQTGGTTIASVNSTGGQGNDLASASSISADGRSVAFTSLASNLVHGDTNDSGDVFVHDRMYRSAYCFGDGSGTLCPCGNSGANGEGCANSTGRGGILSAFGTSSVSADDLVFGASQLIPERPALLLVGSHAVNGGDGAYFGDGLRCAGGNVVRLGTEIIEAGGTARWGPGLGLSGGWDQGDIRRFQVWYRDPPPSGLCGSGFNLTNGIEIVFGL